MPPSNPKKNAPELQVASSRKRKESTRVLENTNPLLPKNRLKATVKRKLVHHASKDTDMSTHPSPSTQRASVDTEEESLLNKGDSINPSACPMVTAQNLEPADESNVEEVSGSLMEVNNDKLDESTESEMRRLSKDWNSTVYAFFKPLPTVEHIDHHHVHVFECRALHCKGKGKYP
ncbi:hypothetical protein EDB87DRAFT_1578247 [Lactarius vividus]|nr:hypothetical protein EDB87DRAFT_1578247 [Lactarius vividus]